MTKALVKREETGELVFTEEQQKIIRNQIFPRQLSNDDFVVFMAFCAGKRLNPIQRQVYAVPRNNKHSGKVEMTIQTGIDGYRAIAARTGQYAGSDDAVFDNELQPKKATVTVYRLVGGVRCPFSASARWDQYYPGDQKGFQWKKMPHVMLGKCAEALALRKGFPEELGGIYTDEEMQQADAETVTVGRPGRTEVIDVPKIEAPVAASPLASRRVKIMESLIGKGKPFGIDIANAKKWIVQVAGVDVTSLNEKGCARVEGLIASETWKPEEEVPPPEDEDFRGAGAEDEDSELPHQPKTESLTRPPTKAELDAVRSAWKRAGFDTAKTKELLATLTGGRKSTEWTRGDFENVVGFLGSHYQAPGAVL